MEHILKDMFGEQSATKVVGLYNSQKDAQAAADKARSLQATAPGQVRLLGPRRQSFAP